MTTFIFSLLFLIPPAQADSTRAERQREVIARNREVAEYCNQFEENFHTRINSVLDGATQTLTQNYECFGTGAASQRAICNETREQHFLEIENYRRSLQLVHQQVVQDWISSQPEQQQNLSRTCPLNRNGQAEFPQNLRTPRVQSSDATLCIDLRANGSDERISRRASYQVNLGLTAFGEQRTTTITPASESEFRSWGIGDRVTGRFSRGRGLYDISR